MPSLKQLLSTVLIATSIISLTTAFPVSIRYFNIQAFEQPGSQTSLTNYYLNDGDGFFYLTKTAPSIKPVLYVDNNGNAFMNTPQAAAQLFLDTSDGHLGFVKSTATSVPQGALYSFFEHLGSGYSVTVTDPSQPQNPGQPPAYFQWLDPLNNSWFACELATAKGKWKLFKVMSNTIPNVKNCESVDLVPLDYNE